MTTGRGAGDVLVVGSVNVDLVVEAARLPAAGETVGGGHFAQHHGGKGANQAVAAARLGASVTFVGAVGDDANGTAARDALKAEGVDTTRLEVSREAATGVALIVVDDRGENQIAVAPGANALVNATQVRSALADYRPSRGDVYLANLELADEAVLAGAELASRMGMTLIINSAPARPLSAALLALRPLLVLNRNEALALTGTADPATAAATLARRTEQPVIVTTGSAGAILVMQEGDPLILPAPDVEAVDATGAGDTLCGALAAELAAGSALVDAARVAVRAASLSVTARGARAGMPTRGMLG